jgi:glycosyltransferase involved in cell wall biosynthesis
MNRADVIGETLECMVTQAGDDVEIIILDGASKDNTPAIVESYRQRFPRLRYIRESINGGVDKDYDRAVQAAMGEYCWLMSDDDLLAPNAVRTVLSAIDRAFSLIVVNAEVRTPDMSEIAESQRLQFDSDREYEPHQMDAFFKDTAAYLSFIGCVVIRRSIWMERERARYFGSLFIHMGVIFQAPLPDRVLVIARPLISIRYGNALWKPKEFEIWMFMWPTLLSSFEHISLSAREAVCTKEPWRKPSALFLYRAKGTYSMTTYRRWIEPRLTTNEGRLVYRGIALIPGFVANLIALVYCLRPNRNTNMMRIDLKKSRYYFGNWFNAR